MKLKRLLALLGSLVVATSASASLVACGSTRHEQKEVEKPELSEVVTNTDLGFFDHENVTNDEILTRVKEKNPSLDLDQVILSSTSVKTNETYRIYLSVSPAATSYRQSSVSLTYTLHLPDLRIEVKQTIKDVQDLGNFSISPTTDEI